ncbi:MAG: hypothetical protein FWE23_04580 [Chitinivibrionia bacterium]|nr:hypothetical protein [Chitinivibrionia bacterium]
MVAVLETENKNNLQLVIKVARQLGIVVRRQRKRLAVNYKNPSPSNDPWWDIPENYSEVVKRVNALENGTAKHVPLDDSELQAIFARCRA